MHIYNEVSTFLRSKGESTGTTYQSVTLSTTAVIGDLPKLEMRLIDLPSKNATPEAVGIYTTSSIVINDNNYDGRTDLHLVIAAGHDQTLILLILKGANVNVVDKWA